MTKLNFQKDHWLEFVICPTKYKQWVVSLGVFDGVHLGHDFLIQRLKKKAQAAKLNHGIITFCSHPQKLLQKQSVPEIYSFQQKKEIFVQKELHSVFFLKFDKILSETSASCFLSALCQKISIRYFYVGYDFFFGKNKEGDIHLLKKFAYDKKFEVIQCKPLQKEQITISSSLIRKNLLAGDFKAAAIYLGRLWSIKSLVVEGKKLARKLGFPTINLELNFLPPLQKGVYIVEIIVQGKKYPAVANYGVAPSIKNIAKAILECHLLGFTGDIYGQEVQVFFYKFLRIEKKFKNLDLLKKQIVLDIKITVHYFKQNKKNANTY